MGSVVNAYRTLSRVAGWTAWVVLAASGFGLTACGDGSRRAPDATAEISLTALATIRPDAVPFGRIADLEVGENGSVFVLDGMNRTIRVFDQAGSELRAFGRRGQGPGEFERPVRLLWGPSGHLWVLDLGNGRLTLFSAGGELVGTYRPSDLEIYFPFALAFSGMDTLQWVGMSSPDPASPAATWVETHASEGEVIPTTRMDLPFVEWPGLFEYRDENMAIVLPVPFSGEPQFGFDAMGRLWYAYTGAPRLHRLSSSGDVELTINADIDPAPVTSMDLQEALASDELEEVRAIGQAAVAKMAGSIPETKPYLAGFFFDDEQRVWVAHAAGYATGSVEREIEIYDLDGTRVGRTRAALAAEPRPRVRDGLLAAVARDELGIESVTLYRIEP